MLGLDLLDFALTSHPTPNSKYYEMNLFRCGTWDSYFAKCGVPACSLPFTFVKRLSTTSLF
jgi:hypothetical protein